MNAQYQHFGDDVSYLLWLEGKDYLGTPSLHIPVHVARITFRIIG